MFEQTFRRKRDATTIETDRNGRRSFTQGGNSAQVRTYTPVCMSRFSTSFPQGLKGREFALRCGKEHKNNRYTTQPSGALIN